LSRARTMNFSASARYEKDKARN